MQRITTFLMFSNPGDSRAAAEHYTAIFKSSRIVSSTPISAEVELDGTRLAMYDGGPHFKDMFNDGISLFVSCANQDEIDYYWDKLLAGGKPTQCGWLKDKFGVSWQIVPTRLLELMQDPDKARAQRTVQAMLKMVKLDIAELERAANDVSSS